MATILDKIYADKKEELSSTKRKIPVADLKEKVRLRTDKRDVVLALTGIPSERIEPVGPQPPVIEEENPGSRIIAEVKLRTPFKGVLREGADPVEIASIYAENGAAALSILTETKYFGGSIDILCKVRKAVDIPLLRKDFIFHDYQVYEAGAFGADFFLLIATWLDTSQMADLLALGKEIGLPALVETHNEKDMEKAFRAQASIIGINNRDLTSGKTDLGISRRLIGMGKAVPGTILVCESGIHSRTEIDELEQIGAHAFLIGESLMTSDDIALKLKELEGHVESKSSR